MGKILNLCISMSCQILSSLNMLIMIFIFQSFSHRSLDQMYPTFAEMLFEWSLTLINCHFSFIWKFNVAARPIILSNWQFKNRIQWIKGTNKFSQEVETWLNQNCALIVIEWSLIRFFCVDCKSKMDPTAGRVLHRWNPWGKIFLDYSSLNPLQPESTSTILM